MKTLAVILAVACMLSLACAGRITYLPGYTGPQLSMYTGYVTVDPTIGKNNFYWLVEARENPDQAPLVFWYQGGPGCSGLFGLLRKLDP